VKAGVFPLECLDKNDKTPPGEDAMHSRTRVCALLILVPVLILSALIALIVQYDLLEPLQQMLLATLHSPDSPAEFPPLSLYGLVFGILVFFYLLSIYLVTAWRRYWRLLSPCPLCGKTAALGAWRLRELGAPSVYSCSCYPIFRDGKGLLVPERPKESRQALVPVLIKDNLCGHLHH